MTENVENNISIGEDLDSYVALIDKVISWLGINVADSKKDKYKWAFYRGSASIRIEIFHSKSNNENYIHISSPVLKIPSTNIEKFYKRLLEINNKLFQASFSIKENNAYLRIIRECKGLDSREIGNMVQRVSYYADEYDDLLKLEFHGTETNPEEQDL
jgi:hypothetical protein